MQFKTSLLIGAAFILGACASVDPNEAYPKVMPFAETGAVASTGDAADDPAIWINHADKSKSLVLGTDKQAGLYVFDLKGEVKDFLPAGRLNNVDLRQGVVFYGDKPVDLAAATNRTINGVSLFAISDNGAVEEVGSFATPTLEPYGMCAGYDESGYRVFVTYKTGEVEIFEVVQGKDGYEGVLKNTLKFAGQLEGCAYDEVQNVLFVGQEATGLWRVDLEGNDQFSRILIDQTGSGSGLVADVEGVDIWRGIADSGYVVASAQEGDRYIIYEREAPNRWVGTFTIGDSEDGLIDGVSHTDGLTVTSTPISEKLPTGMLVVQDDSNGDDGATQNFKYVSWAAIEVAMGGSSN